MASSKTIELASNVRAFIASAKRYGFSIESNGGEVVTIRRRFAPNDVEAYRECDMIGPGLFDYLKPRGGSCWGTDGGSIGGAIGLRDGYYKLNQSGVPKRYVAELLKQLARERAFA
jgi:hypothetical protein